LFLVSQGSIQNLSRYLTVAGPSHLGQTIAMGPVASQEAMTATPRSPLTIADCQREVTPPVRHARDDRNRSRRRVADHRSMSPLILTKSLCGGPES
jgi:hypothetical protein